MISIILENRNFAFFPNDLINFKNIFYYLCNFDYFELARIYLKSKNIDPSFLVDLNDYEESHKNFSHGKTCNCRLIKNDEDEKFVIKTQNGGMKNSTLLILRNFVVFVIRVFFQLKDTVLISMRESMHHLQFYLNIVKMALY